MARPRGSDKLTPALQENICKLIEVGNYPETAALASGVSYQSYYRWMAQGRRDKRGKFREFLKAVKRAKAVSESKNLGVIRDASAKSWQAAAWILERTDPSKFALRESKEKAALLKKLADLERIIYDRLGSNANVNSGGSAPPAQAPEAPGQPHPTPGSAPEPGPLPLTPGAVGE